jgi:hypothetical protein
MTIRSRSQPVNQSTAQSPIRVDQDPQPAGDKQTICRSGLRSAARLQTRNRRHSTDIVMWQVSCDLALEFGPTHSSSGRLCRRPVGPNPEDIVISTCPRANANAPTALKHFLPSSLPGRTDVQDSQLCLAIAQPLLADAAIKRQSMNSQRSLK